MTSEDTPYESRPRPRRRPSQDPGPTALADLMVPALARLGLKTRARQVQVTLAWERVVGEGVARQSRVVNFARGKLTVETASPALSHQLRLQRLDIAARLNLAIGERVVGDISFRLATSPPGEKPA